MNCQEFENGLDALARGSLADARTRAESSAHADECARCAARLADERAITEGLRALRSRLQAAEAPPRVESVLLAAMRAASAPVELGAGPARVEGASGAGDVQVADARRWSWTKTVAVAALAAAASLAFFMLIPPGMSLPPRRSASEVAGTSGKQGGDAAAPASRPQQPDVQTTPVDDARATTPTPVRHDGNISQRAALDAHAPGRPRATEAKFETGGARAAARPQPGVEDAGDAEIVTDFIPLMQGGRFAQGEGGHLVRVELPRSALASFGLPVNAEAGGRVKADVLLGEDGLARAIRFVR